jgi:3-hydroxyacyl-CoA dehydrogenase
VEIGSAAVLGAGTMGAQIAAHLANAGVPVLLLDLTPEAAARGLDAARRLTPDPFFTPETVHLVRTGGFDRDLDALAGCDWVIEAVVEQLAPKRALLARADAARRTGTIVSSNTSALSIAALAEGRSADFRRCWLGTHFFNPPRYLHLLEVVPGPDTSPGIMDAVAGFADQRLGKGVVLAKDTPGFIGNRIALREMAATLRLVASGAWTIEEVDAITGPVLGRPKSATCRTLDVAGLDVVAHVTADLRARLPESERDAFALPPLVDRMIERGLLGEKTGGGFYRRARRDDGTSEILTLDPATLDYRPRREPALPDLAAVAREPDPGRRIAMLLAADGRVRAFLHETLVPLIDYAAAVAPDVAHSPDDVDRALRWGFGWERGPFELAAATRITAGPGLEILRAARERSAIVRRTEAASLVDLSEGVLAVEFHSKMNTVSPDTLAMLEAGVDEAERNFEALVVGSEAPNFSAGADLALVVRAMEAGRWDELEGFIRGFQNATMRLRTAAVPVVVAPQGLTLGGGCEIALHGDRVQASAETYIGLVETAIGLIPGAGGTKEMTARAAEAAGDGDLLPGVQRAFETVAFGRRSTSGSGARALGYLRDVDGITMNRDRLLADARAVALARARGGHVQLRERTAIRVGGDQVRAPLLRGVDEARRAGRISDHDALVSGALASVMSGGASPRAATVSEQSLLDLEREAFLRLLGEPKTLDRIRHTLKTGRPLRN